MKIDQRLFSLCREEEERILVSRVADAVQSAELRGTPKFIGFLGEAERALVGQALRLLSFSHGYFFGGYPQAERVIFGALPEYMGYEEEAFPLRALTFTYRKQDRLSHRDFLGCLMSLMIKREMIGDILVSEGHTTVFVHDNVADMVLQEIVKIGRVGVTGKEGLLPDSIPTPRFQELSSTVASMRFDCVLSFVLGQSREKCVRLIRSGLAAIGGRVVEDVSRQVCPGDTITVRGFGKFEITAQEGITRKGRLVIGARKYL